MLAWIAAKVTKGLSPVPIYEAKFNPATRAAILPLMYYIILNIRNKVERLTCLRHAIYNAYSTINASCENLIIKYLLLLVEFKTR